MEVAVRIAPDEGGNQRSSEAIRGNQGMEVAVRIAPAEQQHAAAALAAALGTIITLGAKPRRPGRTEQSAHRRVHQPLLPSRPPGEEHLMRETIRGGHQRADQRAILRKSTDEGDNQRAILRKST
jgi:hypothetical protein